jgi:D-glycero-D-manno-heptose 1,7-bisphosphate phosphatase
MKSKRAIFLDRDGTLMEEAGYCSDPSLVRVFPGVPAILRRWREEGFLLILITNQSGIGRGMFTEEDFWAVEAEFERQLLPAHLDSVYFAPDAPSAPSWRRKPAAGMLLEAQAKHDIDLERSYVIGDKSSDIACGQAAGCRTILVLTGYGKAQPDCQPDFRAADLSEAAAWIEQNP